MKVYHAMHCYSKSRHFFPYPIWDHHLLRPKRLRKIILGNLGIKNGKWIIENDEEQSTPHGFQFSILNSQLVTEQNYIPSPTHKVLADVYDHL
jgi:hypothetical protein